MRFVFIFIFTIIVSDSVLLAQQKSGKDVYDKKYEWRIRQENLYGVYIPKDINEALRELSRLTDEKSRMKFKAMNEDTAAVKLFFSLGRWMSYNWGFYEGSRLAVHMQSMGIYDPDDMSRFLIILFNRYLNRKPLDLSDLIGQTKVKAEQRKARRQAISVEKKDTLKSKPVKNLP